MNKDNLYLIDTNSLKDFINFQIRKSDLADWKIYCTSVQKIEITRTEDVEKRNNLMDIFQEINPEFVTSPAGYYDLSIFMDDIIIIENPSRSKYDTTYLSSSKFYTWELHLRIKDSPVCSLFLKLFIGNDSLCSNNDVYNDLGCFRL